MANVIPRRVVLFVFCGQIDLVNVFPNFCQDVSVQQACGLSQDTAATTPLLTFFFVAVFERDFGIVVFGHTLEAVTTHDTCSAAFLGAPAKCSFVGKKGHRPGTLSVAFFKGELVILWKGTQSTVIGKGGNQ